MKIHERIKCVVDNFSKSQKEFAESIGESPATVNNWVSGKRKIGNNVTDKILTAFPEINPAWLLTGEGEMLKNDNMQSNAELIKIDNLPEPKPYIDDTYGDCGVPQGFSVAIQASDCELVSIPFISSNYDFSIRARGDSMINRSNPNRSIKDKDIILCKVWKSRSYLKWGEVYALATIDGVVIKKILPLEGDMSKIICESFNKEDNFPDYILSLDEILDWATVEGVFSINKW